MITSSGESFITLLNCQKTSAPRDSSVAFSVSSALQCQDVRSLPKGSRWLGQLRSRIGPPAHPCPPLSPSAERGLQLGLAESHVLG